MKKVLAIVSLALITGCSAPDQAEKALTGAGYTNIELTGYRIFGCDEKDSFHTGFKATGPTGNQVEGVVCAGWLKGATIRLD